jgi:hypothetical protein
MEARRSAVIDRRRGGLLIAIGLLCAIMAGEVLFVAAVAGPDGVNTMSPAEGFAPPL